MGQFAKDYKLMFGKLPSKMLSQTIKFPPNNIVLNSREELT